MAKNSNAPEFQNVPDPGSATGWKRVRIESDSADGFIDSGFSFAFILGVILAAAVMLGYPFYLIGIRVHHWLSGFGVAGNLAMQITAGFGVAYLITIIVASIIHRRTTTPARRKRASILVRVMTVGLPAAAMGTHLYQYSVANTVDPDGNVTWVAYSFIAFMVVAILVVFWFLTTKFLIPKR